MHYYYGSLREKWNWEDRSHTLNYAVYKCQQGMLRSLEITMLGCLYVPSNAQRRNLRMHLSMLVLLVHALLTR